jgi:ribosomal protein S18 acetylase RimI-like enzyme
VEFANLTDDHLPRLHEIRADYQSTTYVRVSRAGQGLDVNLSMCQEVLDKPFRSQGMSIIRQKDRDETRGRMGGSQALQLVAEEGGRLIALLDAEVETWRRVLKIWNLLVDEEHRRQGIGTELMRRAEEFAEKRWCRAVALETQATNWPALCFYTKLGFEICGVDDHFYTNRDLERKEVALFLYRELR